MSFAPDPPFNVSRCGYTLLESIPILWHADNFVLLVLVCVQYHGLQVHATIVSEHHTYNSSGLQYPSSFVVPRVSSDAQRTDSEDEARTTCQCIFLPLTNLQCL